MTEDGPYDEIAAGLQRLRADAGSPSYAALAVAVGRLREARGVPAAAARPGRTTVYDVFRAGRRRLDVDLVLDLVRALGADEEEVARWADACRVARGGPPVVPEPAPAPEEAPRVLRSRVVALVLVGGLALNLVGRLVVDGLHLPLYLDMVGTAVAAVVLGPWWGVLVGVGTNVGGVGISGTVSLAFVPVNVVGALLWGYGARRFAMTRSTGRFFLLNLLVAVACTVVAVPIVLGLGGSGHDSDDIATLIALTSHSVVVAVLSANLLTSVADKLICGFVALAAAEALGAPGTRPEAKPGRRPAGLVRGWTDLTGPTFAEER
jgi:energy-coupling factor transport system substrate-specific component